MRRFRILFILPLLVFITMACALCDEITTPVFDRVLGCDYSPDVKDDMVSKFPQKYSGVVTIKTWNVCDSQANATFSAFDDETCALSISFPVVYQNFEGLMPGDAGYGACKPNGETEGFIINGKFTKDQQVCKLKFCNDQTFSAAGSILFDTKQATGLSDNITCTGIENGEVQIEIAMDSLAPVAP